MKLNAPGRQKIRKSSVLAVGKAYKAIFSPGFKGGTFLSAALSARKPLIYASRIAH